MKTFCEEQIGCDFEIFGYRVLLLAPQIEKKTKGGIILSDEYIKSGNSSSHKC